MEETKREVMYTAAARMLAKFQKWSCLLATERRRKASAEQAAAMQVEKERIVAEKSANSAATKV